MKKIITLCLLMSLGFNSYSQTQKSASKKAGPVKAAAPQAKSTKSNELSTSTEAQNDVGASSIDEMNAKWMAYMTPGKEHDMLNSQAGSWSEEITIWSYAGAEPMMSNAKVKIEMILDGRYQQSTHTGDFEGMPFNGIGLVAFDNASKKYYSSWVDNRSTGLLFSTGTVDPKSKGLVFLGEQPDFITGKMMKVREVMTQSGDSEMSMEMYNTPPAGKEFMSMKIVMKKN